MKNKLDLINYVDLLIGEALEHEEFIISEIKKPLPNISKQKLLDIKDTNEEFVDYNKIADEILKSETVDDIEFENNNSIEKDMNFLSTNLAEMTIYIILKFIIIH